MNFVILWLRSGIQLIIENTTTEEYIFTVKTHLDGWLHRVMIGVLMDQDQFFGEGVCNFKGDLLTQDTSYKIMLLINN